MERQDRGAGGGGSTGKHLGPIPDSPPTACVTGRKISWTPFYRGAPKKYRKFSEITQKYEKNLSETRSELLQVMDCLKEGHFPCECPLRPLQPSGDVVMGRGAWDVT